MAENELLNLLADLKENETLDLARAELAAGNNPMDILNACREGMILVGERFTGGEYYLPELIMAGEIFKEVSEIIQPHLGKEGAGNTGVVVFGTVQGDVHDIGKDMVVAILQGVGFKVHDLGVDVPPEKFVEKIKETGATVLGLSGLITTAYDSMKETVEALEEAGLRDKVRIMVGGGIMDENVRAYTGADSFGNDPVEAIRLCKEFLGG